MRVAIVVPCYNEAEVLGYTASVVAEVLGALVGKGLASPDSFVLFVDDGSADGTWGIIDGLAKEGGGTVRGLKLVGNVGHQNALFAGLMAVREHCDCAISMDADLQDDTEAINGFLEKHREGYQVVYGIREGRDTDTAFKRGTARAFYRVMNALGVKLRYDHADYRLMSRQALDALSQYQEGDLFLRGIVPLLGFPGAQVYYSRKERAAGETKYPLRKMVALAISGITSFSNAPIRLITYLGCAISLLSFGAVGYALYSTWMGRTVSGWASLMISVWFIGGMQFIAIGVVGEYIGKIFMEVKRRPRYIVEREV